MSDESRCPTCTSSERNHRARWIPMEGGSMCVECTDPWHAEPVPVQPAEPATPQPLPDCAACVAPDQGVAHVEGTRQHPRAETATPKMQEALDRVASMAHDMIMLLASKTNIVKGDLAATVMKLADIRNEARAALAAPDAPPEKENGQ